MSSALLVDEEPDQFSLKELAKRSLIDDMLEVVKRKMELSNDLERAELGSKSYLALIVDQHTLRIISGACRQYDLQERGVTVVEQIEKPRQALLDLDAVYFLSPTETSAEMLVRDHHQSSLYRYSHVFFSGPLPEKCFDLLAKEEGLVNRCYSLAELNVDFVPFEPRAFHCDKPLAIRQLRANDANAMTSLVRGHVNSLVSVCAALHERPVIRYMARSTVSNLSEKIALGFKRELDVLALQMDKLRKPFKAKGTTVVIMDRSIDSAALLVHEYSYQALALDVLDGVSWPVGFEEEPSTEANMSVLPSFVFTSVTTKGEEESKSVILGDHDELWRKFRHMHVKDVSEITTSEIRDFSRNHSLAKLQKDGRRNSDADPMELLRGLPEYQDILSKYALHIELSKQCFDALERFKLFEVGKIEQELATGVDEEGKDVSCIKIFQTLTSLLQSGRIGAHEKLRLVALYLSQVNDVNESSAQTLVRTAASLSVENEALVKQFLGLGIQGTRAAAVATARHSHKADKAQLKRNKVRAKASGYVNCRFVPRLKDIAESVLTNTVDAAEFPLVGGGTAASSVYSVTSSDGGQKKSAAAAWGQDKAVLDGGEAKTGGEKERQKLILFVIGGITLSETRAMEELGTQFGCDVIIGGSTILTPKRLISILQNTSL